MSYDLTEFVRWITEVYEPLVRVGTAAGDYARRVGDNTRELYGIADMACILYTIDELHPTESERQEWLEGLQSFQDPGSGYLIALTASLSKVHNTAFAIGAMNLFEENLSNGKRPEHRLRFARNFDAAESMERYVGSLNWETNVYESGENSIGLASAFANVTDTVGPEWFAWLMNYFDTRFDPNNGMLGQDKPSGGDTDQIGGTFHFAFFWEYFGRQMPFSDQRVDAILGLQGPTEIWAGDNPWWMPFDSIYMLSRVASYSDYRKEDIRNSVQRAVEVCYERAMDQACRETDFYYPELGVHTLTGAISLFAVAQQFLGDEIISPKPLRLVLDRRPYI